MEHTNRGLKTGSTKNTIAQRSSEDKGENCRPLCLEREKKTTLSAVAKVVMAGPRIFPTEDTIVALSKENNSCSSRSQDVWSKR